MRTRCNCDTLVNGWWLTSEGERWGEDDMDPSTVDVKHDAKVDSYAAQNCKAVDKGPVGRIQRDLTNKRWRRQQKVRQVIYIFF